jgi:ribosomal protein L24E
MKYVIIITLVFLIPSKSFTQRKGDVFITKDSLTQLIFVNEHKVHYILYSRSPYILRKTMRFIDNFHTEADDSGLGDYLVRNDSLIIKFTEKNNFIDSIAIKKNPKDSKNKFIEIHSREFYSKKPADNHPIQVLVGGKTFNNHFDNDISVPLTKEMIPFTLVIRSIDAEREIQITKHKSLLIEYYQNEFYDKFRKTKASNLSYLMSDLIPVSK